ncbi:MAG TPA: hypothetical protein PKW49_01125 [Paludibacteraceae bacterium]|nr:hypothetical protein [Paludibacteraceae bacterium]
MARFAGEIGYSENVQTAPGVWKASISKRNYKGDVLRNNRQLERSDTVNANIAVNNSFSIVADAYAFQNFFNMLYLRWLGTNWIITNVEVQRPRLILTIGGVYNGNTD